MSTLEFVKSNMRIIFCSEFDLNHSKLIFQICFKFCHSNGYEQVPEHNAF